MVTYIYHGYPAIPPPGYMKKKIIIVEDEAIISLGYRMQLQRLGFDVLGTARSFEQAMDLLAKDRPDIILMDIYLRGTKTGLELAQEIHAVDPIPILFLSASTSPEIIEAIHKLKGCDYLTKPINTDSLEEMLEMLAQKDIG